MAKIYVGNLPYATQKEELSSLFEKFGKVDSAEISIFPRTGLSRGFGFVEMADSNDAERAISEMNGYELNGRSLRVSIARENDRESRGGKDHHAKRGNRNGRPYGHRHDHFHDNYDDDDRDNRRNGKWRRGRW